LNISDVIELAAYRKVDVDRTPRDDAVDKLECVSTLKNQVLEQHFIREKRRYHRPPDINKVHGRMMSAFAILIKE
jgi:hypothetical protein